MPATGSGRCSDGSKRFWAADGGRAAVTPSPSHNRDDQLSSGPEPASFETALGDAKLAAVALQARDQRIQKARPQDTCGRYRSNDKQRTGGMRVQHG